MAGRSARSRNEPDGSNAKLLTARPGWIDGAPLVYRFHPLVREIRARVAAGEFGEFGAWQVLHGSYLQDWLVSRTATNWRVNSAIGAPHGPSPTSDPTGAS